MTIIRAHASMKWPGVAAVFVSVVFVTNAGWSGYRYLDGASVSTISPTLDLLDTSKAPHRLFSNLGLSSEGSKLYGRSFVLDDSVARKLMSSDPGGDAVVLPFNTGDDFNKSPQQSALRWCIDFRTLPLPEVRRTWPNICLYVETHVKPERDAVSTKRTREIWWQHERPRPELYVQARKMERVLCRALVTSVWGFAFVSPKQVFANKLTVCLLDRWEEYSVLQSAIHEHWAWAWGSTMKGDLNYSHSDCFQTFPFPSGVLRETGLNASLEAVGRLHHMHRASVMIEQNEGLTELYHQYCDPNEISAAIQKLRQIQVEMDDAVAAAYGWTDLDLGHGFHETKQGVRYTISEPARREVLARLLKLNHERYAEEVKQGLHEKKKPKSAKKPREQDVDERNLRLFD